MRWLSCSMAGGCNWMQDCLKPVSLCSDTTFPLQAREFQWGSVSVNGSTNSSSQHCPSMGSWSRRCLISIMGGELIAGRASFRRSGRRSRPLVLLHGVWAGTVASGLSMGVEPATLTGKDDARGQDTRDRMGTCQGSSSLSRARGKPVSGVWTVASGSGIWTCRRAVRSRYFRLARRRNAALSSGSQPVVE